MNERVTILGELSGKPSPESEDQARWVIWLERVQRVDVCVLRCRHLIEEAIGIEDIWVLKVSRCSEIITVTKKCQEVFHSSPTAFSSSGAFYSYPLDSQLALQNRSNAVRVVTAPALQQVVRIFRAI